MTALDSVEAVSVSRGSQESASNGSNVDGSESESRRGRSVRLGMTSPVGRLLSVIHSPLARPWSRRTVSESESEESVSHTGQSAPRERLWTFPRPIALL